MRVNLWMLSLMSILALAATANAQPGGGGRGGRGGGMFGRGGMLSIVKNEAVQKELGLSADDAAKVKTVTDEFDAAATAGDRPNFRDMSPEERTKAFAKMAETAKANNEKFLPKLKEVLTADQFTRLQQIHLQVAGIDALTESDVIKSLAISTEQQESIKTINSNMETKRNELFASLSGGGGGGDMREKMGELTKERETKINEVLTKDQQDKFATLKGKEFDVSQLRPQGRGPGGGGGGGGGGGRGKRPQPKAE